MDEMLIEFSSDLKEMLSVIKDALMRVDGLVGSGKTAGVEDLNEMFRNLHTIKGTCSFFEMNITRNLAHKMEDLLELFLQGKGTLNKEHVQLMFDGVDCLDRIAKGICENVPETNFAEEATEIKDKILACIDEIESPGQLESEKKEFPPDKLSDAIPQTKPKTTQETFVRIPVNKLELLMDLLGEVILVASMVTNHPDIQGLELEDFENTSNQLDLMLRQLQDAKKTIKSFASMPSTI